jgi:long-subunit acyl-CoA synthetase (AMP-forming)
MTETCAGAIYNVEDCPEYDTERNSEFVSVGVCMPGMKMRVMGPHGTEAKDKETGLLQVSGPVVFKEYLNSPEETTKSFTNDGWFRTGDLASLDDHGRLYICGRETDTIVSNGYGRLFALFSLQNGCADFLVSNIPLSQSKQRSKKLSQQ